MHESKGSEETASSTYQVVVEVQLLHGGELAKGAGQQLDVVAGQYAHSQMMQVAEGLRQVVKQVLT